jgi:uncharacterized protein
MRPDPETPMTPKPALLEKIDRGTITPDISRPDPAKRISGDPVHTTWNQHDANGLYCGIWQSTPGSWHVSYTEWEYFCIRQGHSILTDADGRATHLRVGDSYMIHRGFTGTWQVVETTLKDYVILT